MTQSFIPLWCIVVLAWLLLKTRMAHRKTLETILEIVVAWAVLFTVAFFIPQITWPWNLRIGIIVTAALAIFSVVYFCLSGEEASSTQVEVKLPETTRALQLVPGGDELLVELERVDVSCGRIVQSLGASGQDVKPLIIELSHLCFTLVQLSGKYTGQWPLSLDNRVTMVTDQLGKAGSALSGGGLEHTRMHIDGAAQSARALITYLKSEQPPSS